MSRITVMKAWFVWVGYEWGDYVHGETPGKAKAMFWKTWAREAEEWNYLRPIRDPELDDTPLTRENISLVKCIANIEFWEPICDCRICKGDPINE